LAAIRRGAKEEAKQQAAETVGAKLPLFLARQTDRVKDGNLRPLRAS
jgi:hypothetical protein